MKNLTMSLALFAIGLCSNNIFAQSKAVQAKGFNNAQLEKMAKENIRLANIDLLSPQYGITGRDSSILYRTTAKPFAEFEKTGYLIFSELYNFDSKDAKMTIAKHLPKDVKLVVYTDQSSTMAHNRIKRDFQKHISPDRLEVITLPNAQHGFWSRDGVPVPVWREGSAQKELFSVVDARYYYPFEADQLIANTFSSELTKHSYYFEGGNFMANSLGDCIVINTRATRSIPDLIFEQHYGCQKLIRLPYLKGIGHVDESVKFVDDNTVLTDAQQYASRLKQEGFRVKMLPRPKTELETYVNSLIVNGVVYIPIFNQATDSQAIRVYESLGLKAVGIPSTVLSNRGQGSIHCITMTYPPTEFQKLKKSLGAK